MQVQVKWTSGTGFEGTNPDGLGVVMDAHPEPGETAGGPAPMETLLMALSGCPRVLTTIHIRYSTAGPGLRVEQVEKAVALSQEKHCAVSAMLRKAAPVTYDMAMVDTNVARQELAV